MATATKPPTEKVVTLKRLEKQTLRVPIVGTSPLIVHAWSAKAKQMMLDKQMGVTKPKKEAKNPQEDYEASLYRMPDGVGYGFPAPAFKAAIVGAARYFDDLTMVTLRRSLFLLGEGQQQLQRLTGEPQPREDMVRIGNGTADIRFRGVFEEWSAVLVIRYFPQMLSEDAIFALVDAGGAGGVGEWRPEKSDTGMYGTFEVATVL